MIKENLNTTWNIKENSKFIDGKDDATIISSECNSQCEELKIKGINSIFLRIFIPVLYFWKSLIDIVTVWFTSSYQGFFKTILSFSISIVAQKMYRFALALES